jgi:RNA polymerase sigma-70 factor (ECF subfamily)
LKIGEGTGTVDERMLSPATTAAAAWDAPVEAASEASVAELYQREATAIRTVLGRLKGPGTDVDDLLQEVFVVALRKSRALGQARSPRAWLFGVAVKIAATHRRRARLRRLFSLDSADEPHARGGPAESLEQAEARRTLLAVLDRLSEKKRSVFVLFELEGLSGEEIAQAVGCPPQTVWTRLHHARLEFIDHLKRLALQEQREQTR